MATAKPKPRATASAPAAKPAAPKAKSSFKVKQSYSIDTTKVYEIIRGGGILCKIKSETTVYDEERGGIQAIRYCPNEPSIYRTDQSEYAQREHVVFRDKLLMAPKNKPNLQEFLDKHPDNAANGGNIFKLIDKNASAEELLEQEFSQHEAVSLVRDKSVDELLPVAMYLDININQKNAEIKRELLIEAKSNPTQFIQLFDNPQVKCRSAVMQAVDFQILNSKIDGMYWYDSNRLIVSAPVGTDAVEVTTRFFMTEKGATAYERVLEQLENI